MRPTNTFFRFFGIAPTTGRWRFLYCIVPFVAACTVIASVQLREYKSILNYWFVVLPSSLGALQHLLTTNANPGGFQTILDDLEEVAEQLRGMGEYIEDQKLTKTMIVVVVTTLFNISTRFRNSRAPIEAALYVANTLLLIAAWIQHMMFAQLIHKRFAALNDQLTRIAASADRTLLQIVETRLDSVFRVHSTLHVIVTDVSSHFCIFNLLCMASLLFGITNLAYQILEALTHDEARLDIPFVYSAVCGTIYIVCQVAACNSCAKEANRTPQITRRILNENSPIRLWEKIGQFSRLNLDNKVEFSVGGIFSFEMKLLTKMASMAFTYLTIAIQLKDVSILGRHAPSDAATSVNSTGN